MKRIVLPALLGFALLIAAPCAFGQNAVLDKALQEEVKKNKEKSDKDITSDKAKDKAKTWLDRGRAYEEVAVRYAALDSNAALMAYDAYKKAVELGNGPDSKGAKYAKEASDILGGGAGSNLYVALLQQGVGKYNAKNLRGALTLFQTASLVNPKDTSSSSATMLAGIAAQQLDDQKLARESFEKYLAAGGKDPAIFYAVANAYKTEKNFEKAIEFLDKGIVANPTNKDLKSEKVNLYLASGKSEDAIANLKQLAADDPNNVQNVLNLAILYDNAYTQANDEIRKSSTLSKKGDQLKKKIADQKDKVSVYTGEKTKLQASTKKAPKNAELKRQLNEVTQKEVEFKSSLAQTEQELKDYTAAQASASGSTVNLPELTRKAGENRKQAQEFYGKALQLEPANYDANFNMGVGYFNEGVEIKNRVDAMDMTTYGKEGKSVEQEAITKFKQGLPFFEKAFETNQTEEVKSSLKNTYTILKGYEKTDAYDAKLQKLG